MSSSVCRLLVGFLLLVLAQAARPAFESSSPFESAASLRQLHQAQQALNCTPPHPANAIKVPFCFQPDTVSTEARQFLAQAAAGATPLGASASSGIPADAAAAAAAVQTLRDFYRDLNEPLHAAAVQQHLQDVRNSTVGNVSVVIGVPKGAEGTDPGNTKVVIYMHGESHSRSQAALQCANALPHAQVR
jgi:hypothetical protein